MKKVKASFCAIAILCGIRAFSQNPPQNVINDIQNILNNARTTELAPGAVLSINAVGQWNYTWASGVRDLVTNTPVTGNERFRIGSVTKNFIATSILKLANQNILNLDDPISLWLSPTIMNVIPNGNLMTIRHLLNHTSGMADYINDPENTINAVFSSNPLTQFSFEEIMLTYFAPLTPVALPSTSNFNYTNTGYKLLGEIIKNASGVTYKQYFEQNIFNPLNLTNTTVPATGEYNISGTHLNGYITFGGQQYNDITIQNTSWANGDGDMISNTSDLNNYFKNLLEGNIIPTSYVNMMTNFSSTDGGYGLGCYEIYGDGVQWYGHSGSIPGYGTNMFYCPSLNTYVSINYNYDGADMNPLLLEINTYLNSTLSSNNNNFNESIATAFPNPTNGIVTIKISNYSGEIDFTLVDLSGRKVSEQNKTNFHNEKSFDFSGIDSGTYLLNIKTNEHNFVKKIIINK
ncbi:serine hydrolase [Flavobacterium macrobrachii]|uniref:serine hydrolase n=1 Tax=Flavobacterium macrobrachii TaxID=591204 RepID=UPI003F7284E1